MDVNVIKVGGQPLGGTSVRDGADQIRLRRRIRASRGKRRNPLTHARVVPFESRDLGRPSGC